jgi:glycine oxidase
MPDVIIIGAGIVGCASALALARRGARVVLIERADFGVDAASSAAAGILGVQLERHADPAMQALCIASRARYDAWLLTLGDGDVGFRARGSMRLAFDDASATALATEVDTQRVAGLDALLLDGDGARAREPALSPRVVAAACFGGDALIDPPLLLASTRAAAERHGVVLRTRDPVARVTPDGVTLEDGEQLCADVVVDAAGSWATRIGALDLDPDAVRPARGQMLELTAGAPPIRSALEGPDAYLSPRDDGRVLIGSTVELVGFERAVTAGAVQELLAGAVAMVPSLASARFTGSWCGFRALTRDELPAIGRVAPNVVLASGHHRNGVLLAPITADIVTALIYQEPPPVDITAFDPRRLTRNGA